MSTKGEGLTKGVVRLEHGESTLCMLGQNYGISVISEKNKSENPAGMHNCGTLGWEVGMTGTRHSCEGQALPSEHLLCLLVLGTVHSDLMLVTHSRVLGPGHPGCALRVRHWRRCVRGVREVQVKGQRDAQSLQDSASSSWGRHSPHQASDSATSCFQGIAWQLLRFSPHTHTGWNMHVR